MDPVQLHFEKLIHMYASARINEIHFSSSTMNFNADQVEIRFTPDATLHHSMGFVHGSVAFKLLDDAAFFASQAKEQEFALVTTGFNIHFLRIVSDTPLLAIGKLKQKSKNLWISESRLLDNKNRELAFGTGSFMKSNVLLSTIPAYC